jgi:hypothetical protein
VVVTLGVITAVPEIPDAAKLPPVQDVALVELHERVDDHPAFTEVGLAESEAVGAGGGGGGGGGGGAATVTAAAAVADPPVPEQAIE